MSIVDLDVNRWCETVYALQREIEESGPVDKVSVGDYRALAQALRDAFHLVQEKHNLFVEASKS